MRGELPRDWIEVELGQIAQVQLGKMLSSKAKSGIGSRPYLRNVNVRWHRIDVSEVFSMDFDSREGAKYELKRGDVLVCEGGEPGRAAIWSEQLPGALYQKALHRVRFSAGAILPRYFTHFLELKAGNGGLGQHFTGSTIKHLPLEAFLELKVPVPPLAEQRRVVAALEEHLSELDAAVAGLERARANARQLRVSTLQSAFDWSRSAGATQKSPDAWGPIVPAHWTWETIENLSQLVEYGTSAKTSEDEMGVPVLRMGNIIDGRLSWENLKFLPSNHEEFPKLFLKYGDVLFNRTNSPELVGKCAVYRDRGTDTSFASYLLRIRLKKGALPEFVVSYINSTFGRAWVGSVVTQQVGQANVNGSKLRALRIPIPPLDEQREIISRLEEVSESSRRIEGELERQLLRATRLRQSILKSAFEGTLVPQDPNDEPASVLLERIRAERATPAPSRARRRPRVAKSTR